MHSVIQPKRSMSISCTRTRSITQDRCIIVSIGSHLNDTTLVSALSKLKLYFGGLNLLFSSLHLLIDCIGYYLTCAKHFILLLSWIDQQSHLFCYPLIVDYVISFRWFFLITNLILS